MLGVITGLSGACCQVSRSPCSKFWGFLLFIASDVFLTIMGLYDGRLWFTGLQVAFAVISLYGVWTHRPSTWRANG